MANNTHRKKEEEQLDLALKALERSATARAAKLEEERQLDLALKALEKSATTRAAKLEEEYGSSAYGGTTWLNEQYRANKLTDIAPVRTTTTTTKKEEEDEGLDFFKKGALEDGITVGNITKTILGTGADVISGVAKGAAKTVGGVLDLGTYGMAGVADFFGDDELADRMRESAQRNVIDDIFRSSDEAIDELSILGRTSDAVMEGLGQVGTVILTGGLAGGAVGATAATTGLMGASSMGAGMSEAYMSGATDEEAATYGLIKGVVDAGSELLFGGLGKTVKAVGLSKGLTSVDDMLAQKLSGKITNQIAKNFVEYGVKASGEGLEEVIAGVGSAMAKQATYMDEKELGELLEDEDLLEQFVVGAVTSGVAQSGLVPGMTQGSLRESNKTGRDFITGMTESDQKVVDRLVEEHISQKETDGKKLTQKEKNEVYDSIIESVERGEISLETIAEVLDADSYKAYKDLLASEESAMQELAELYEGEELQKELTSFMENAESKKARAELDEKVFGLVKNGKLAESYLERGRRGQSYQADVTKYDEKQRATIQKAIDSGVLNNTRRTHEFVDLIAKITADKGVVFDFTSNKKLAGTIYAVDGKTVNGFVTDSGVTLNVNSKKALNRVVGHEITHVLEGTELYNELQNILFEYAKGRQATDSKFDSEYKERLYDTRQLYKEIEGYNGVEGFKKIKNEVAADLVGDYLFTDAKFVNRLVKNRNLFQKIWDEVKYLHSVSKAGSDEAKKLLEVQRAFEKAYKEGGKFASDSRINVSDTSDIMSREEYDLWRIDELNRLNPQLNGAIKGEIVDGDYLDGTSTDGSNAMIGSHYGSTVRRTKSAKSGTFTHELLHAIDMLTGHNVRHYVEDLADGKGFDDYNSLLSYLKSAREQGKIDGRTTDAEEIAQMVLHAFYADRAGLRQAAPDFTSYLEGMELDKYSHVAKNYNEYLADNVTEEQNERGLKANEEVSFSLSKDTEYMDKAISTNDSMMRVDSGVMLDAKALRERIATRMLEIKDKGLVGLPEDIEGNTYIANSSYDGTEENTTICPRSLASEAFVDAVSEYLGRPLTVEEQIYISQDLQGRTLTPECMYCYVATDRKAYRAFLGEYVAQRDAVLEKLKANPNADISRSGELYTEFLNGRKDTNPMYNRFKMWADAYKNGKPMIDASHLANISKLMGDINSEFGADLKPQIVDAMKYAQSASWAKKRINYVAYNGHILKWKQDRINKLNSHYGLRMYSFSDFHPAFVLENMQMITDASVRGLKMLGYTKDTDFVEIFAPTGMNINVSTFGFESGGNVYENNITGANWDTAKALREQYPNVGVTFVATNDTLVEWALAQDWIDVVIPFHLVRTGKEVAKALNYHDYTGESSDTKDVGWTKGADKKYIAPTEHNNDKATYLASLAENHLKPRFERFLDNPNYMKLVNECRQPASESRPVQPIFNEDAAMNALAKLEVNGYYQPIGGSVSRMYEIAADVAEDMTKQIAPTMSLSNEGDVYAPIGDYNVYGEDVALTQEETQVGSEENLTSAPVSEVVRAENATTTMFPDDLAPMADDAERIASLTDADAPPPSNRGRLFDVPEEQTMTVEERRAAKLKTVQTELAENTKHRMESLTNYNQEIVRLQNEYDAKKNKNTKVANDLLRRIERVKGLRDRVDADYAKRISDLQTREKLLREGKPTTRQELHNGIVDHIKGVFKGRGFDFDQVLKKAKDLSTFATVDNIPQRVMEKALGYNEGRVLADITVNKVAQNETEGIKWLNEKVDLIKSISKQYGIKPGSKESAAAQMYAEGFYVDENNDIIAYGDAELAKDFPDTRVQANIKAMAADGRIRQIYDETLDAINESRRRNAYPEIPRLDNYYLHFRAMDDTFSRLGLPFNPNDIRAKDLPTDLNGVTADLKPGQPYFASAMHRKGKRTSFDMLGGLERYLNSAKNQIYHIDDIQTLRALRNYIADTYGQANGLEGLDALSEEEAQDRIEQVYGSHLSTFAKFLNEEANVLAGKTALIDRGLEGMLGRRAMTFMKTLNGQVGSNMVGMNVSSSLTNFLPVVQAFAKANKGAFVKGFAQTASNRIGSIFGRTDGFAEQSPVMIRRQGADRFHLTPWQKAADVGYTLMSAVDNISTEVIARAKYNELVAKGMDSQTAHYETDKWVSRLMGDRSLGQMPQLYNSKALGLITKFQLEVRIQLDSQFYDTIQEAKASNEDIANGLERNARTAAKVTSTLVQLAVAQHLFGQAFQSIAGYNPAFDIIEVLMTACGFDDDEDSEDTVLDNIEQGFFALLEDLPYTSTLTGGRIPIASALPVTELIKGVDEWGNEKSRWETLGEVAPYYILPAGYGQIKKTAQGLNMFDGDHPIAGSYTQTNAFEDGYQVGDAIETILGTATDGGNLRFPVEDTMANRIQAGIFGQWASENARDYFDNGRSPLKEKQIQEFVDVEMPIRDYWDYREGLSEQESLEDKFEYIDSLDLPVDKKNILINNIVDRKEKVDMTGYDNFSGYEEFDFYSKNTEKYNFLKINGVSYEEYMASEDTKKDYDDIYTWYNNNPEKVTLSKAVTDNVIDYKRYTGTLNDIRADKDVNGKSINGTAKAKKAEYINNLDLDYGAKLILFKSEYNADDTYNMEIIDYLNSRADISYEETVTILKELGFSVSADGTTVTW